MSTTDPSPPCPSPETCPFGLPPGRSRNDHPSFTSVPEQPGWRPTPEDGVRVRSTVRMMVEHRRAYDPLARVMFALEAAAALGIVIPNPNRTEPGPRLLYVLEPNGIREATQAECKERVRWEIDADPKVIPFSGLLAVARGEGL
jgi:hypothetical protein